MGFVGDFRSSDFGRNFEALQSFEKDPQHNILKVVGKGKEKHLECQAVSTVYGKAEKATAWKEIAKFCAKTGVSTPTLLNQVATHNKQLGGGQKTASAISKKVVSELQNCTLDLLFNEFNKTKPNAKHVQESLNRLVQQHGADYGKVLIHAVNSEQMTFLALASKYGQTALASYLLQLGANVNAVDKHGLTPLMHAVRHEQTQVTKLLLTQQADTECKGPRQKTALFDAVALGSLEQVMLLLAAHANLHAKDSQGLTPLFYALRANRADIANYLLSKGATFQEIADKKDSFGKTALEFAFTTQDPDLLKRAFHEKVQTEPKRTHQVFARAIKTIRHLHKDVAKGGRPMHADYIAEVLDAKHRYGRAMLQVKKVWETLPKRSTRDSFDEWLKKLDEGQDVPGKKVMQALHFLDARGNLDLPSVRYLDEHERLQYRLERNAQGLLSSPYMHGTPFHTEAEEPPIFVIAPDNTVYVGPYEKGAFNHSSFLEGRPVKCAGEMYFYNGKLAMITDRSGHYATTLGMLIVGLKALEAKGIDLEHVISVIGFGTDEQQQFDTKELLEKESRYQETLKKRADFVGSMDDLAARRALEKKPPGTYLVRYSPTEDVYYLTIKTKDADQNDTYQHVPIHSLPSHTLADTLAYFKRQVSVKSLHL